MSFNFKLFIFVLSFLVQFIPMTAFSQAQTKDKVSITFDGAALGQQGVGFKVDYAFRDSWTVGAFGKQYESDSEGLKVRSGDAKKYQFSEVGFEVSYYPNTVFASGIYTSLGFASGKNKITYYDITLGSLSDEDSDSGAQAKIGYQFAGELGKEHRWLIQLGLGYGACGEGDWELFYSPETAIYSDLKSGALMDFNFGMTF